MTPLAYRFRPERGAASRVIHLQSKIAQSSVVSTVRCLAALSLVLLLFPGQLFAGAMLLHIGSTSPRMAQRGTTVEVTVQGMCLKDAREVVFYKPGIRAISIEVLPNLAHPIGLAHGGRIEEQIRCVFEIAPDCVPGEHPFRIRTDTEITSLGTFHVSPFTMIDENEQGYNSNDTITTALSVSPNTTVRGRMGASARGDVDVYRVTVAAGQTLSAEVDAVRIADIHYGDSAYDLTVRILDASGRELSANDDNSLHLQDPMASVLATDNQDVFVEVRRSLFAPADKDYCLHIGTNRRPLIAYPLGGTAGSQQIVELAGDPAGLYEQTIQIPSSRWASGNTFEYFGEAPSPILLRSSHLQNLMEDKEAAFTVAESLPVALNGRIDQRGDVDSFRVTVSKQDRWRVRVYAATLGSSIDPTIRIRPVDSAGVQGEPELEADDCSLVDRDVFGTSFRSGGGLKEILDPSVIWQPRLDGDYMIEVSDTSGVNGATAVYRIEVERVVESVHTVLMSTAFDWEECIRTSGLVVPQGNRWTVNVSLPRGQGTSFQGELELIAHGLPEGVTMVSGRVPAGRTIWPVQFVADEGSQPGTALITLEAESVDPNVQLESRSQQMIPFINHSGGDAWRTVRLDQFVFAVTKPAPFSVEISAPQAALVRGGELGIPVRIIRQEGFNDPVEIQCDWVPPGVSVQPAQIIPAGVNEAVLRITGDLNAPLGKCPIVLSASTTRDDLDAYLGTGRIRVSSSLVELIIAEPFVELSSEPQTVRRGERKKYNWTIQHKSPFEGSASIKLLGLPRGVNVLAPFPMLTRDSKEVSFEIEATNEALLGSIRGVSCEITVESAGQEIRQRTGNGTLRIDPRLE